LATVFDLADNFWREDADACVACFEVDFTCASRPLDLPTGLLAVEDLAATTRSPEGFALDPLTATGRFSDCADCVVAPVEELSTDQTGEAIATAKTKTAPISVALGPFLFNDFKACTTAPTHFPSLFQF
jgi:hypothetical protein